MYLQESSGVKGICSYIGGGGVCKDLELFVR